jgi:hypothetical protein
MIDRRSLAVRVISIVEPTAVAFAITALAIGGAGGPLAAQTGGNTAVRAASEGQARVDPVHAHTGHVSDAFRGTPEGLGLLPTAIAEAEIAHRHATLAGNAPSVLESVQRHAGHVIHALDPDRIESGPGLGYGVVAAAQRTAHHIELAAASDGASDGVRTHAIHVATAARNAAANAAAALELGEEILASDDADEATRMLADLTVLTDAIVNGVDDNQDGRIGWRDGEGGLAQASAHLALLRRGEGLGS